MQNDTTHNSQTLGTALEKQVEQGNLFTHTALSRHSARINEIESFLYAVVDLMTKRGIASPDELKEMVSGIRQEMFEKGETCNPGIALRVDGEEDKEFIPVNCEERLHICQAVCCKLEFALSAEEVEAGIAKWELGRPYFIRRGNNCHCAHINPENLRCNIYEHRPSVCKKYSCANDPRIWKDFEKMELNQAWIDENIREAKLRFSGAPMFSDQRIIQSK